MTWHTNTTGRSTDRPQGPEVYRPRYDQDDYYEEPSKVVVVDFNGNEITAHPGFPRCGDCGAEIRSGATVVNSDGVFHESCRW